MQGRLFNYAQGRQNSYAQGRQNSYAQDRQGGCYLGLSAILGPANGSGMFHVEQEHRE